jgi:hypothetical protein
MNPMMPHDSCRGCLLEASRGSSPPKLDLPVRERLLPALITLILPSVILCVLVRLLPPWTQEEPAA